MELTLTATCQHTCEATVDAYLAGICVTLCKDQRFYDSAQVPPHVSWLMVAWVLSPPDWPHLGHFACFLAPL